MGYADVIGLRGSLACGVERAGCERAGWGASVVVAVLGELSGWRIHLENSWPVFWCTLLGLVGATVWTIAGHRVAGRWVAPPKISALLTIGFAVVWVLVDKRLEGPVLFPVTVEHGVTLSDLVSVVAVLVAAWRLSPL